MIKTLKPEKAATFLRTLVLLDNAMNTSLSKWSLDINTEEILEESPWLDEDSAKIAYLESDLTRTIELSEEFLKISSGLYEEDFSLSKVRLELYFKSPLIEVMRNVINTGTGVKDDIFMSWRGRFSKAFTALRHLVSKAFDVDKYLEGVNNRIYDVYESQYGSLSTYFTEVQKYCIEKPVFISEIVNNNAELFTRLFAENPEMSREDFDNVSEAVMPWDITMFNRGELKLDESYYTRLINRIEDNTSVYNDVPTIVDVLDTLPEDKAADLYKYEFMIAVETVEYIKAGQLTWTEVLDKCQQNAKTSYF